MFSDFKKWLQLELKNREFKIFRAASCSSGKSILFRNIGNKMPKLYKAMQF